MQFIVSANLQMLNFIICINSFPGFIRSVVGLVVKYLVAIEVPGVRFPDDAYLLSFVVASNLFLYIFSPGLANGPLLYDIIYYIKRSLTKRQFSSCGQICNELE